MDNRPEDINSRTFRFSIMVFNLVKTIQIEPTFMFLINQLLRSATSIGANVIEGKSSSSRKELTRYYQIALKSANETKYWLLLLQEVIQTKSELLLSILDECEQLSKILGKSVVNLKSEPRA
jgi:four helix bundle protein